MQVRARCVAEVCLPDDADAEPGEPRARFFEIGQLHDHHVAVVTAVLVEQTAGGRALLLRRHDFEERVADREQRVHETELGDAGIAVADVDTEGLAQRVDRGLEVAGDEGDLAKADGHGAKRTRRRCRSALSRDRARRGSAGVSGPCDHRAPMRGATTVLRVR